jgi:hypothetical protein
MAGAFLSSKEIQMDLYILTHGRVDRQVTYDNLPEKWQKRVVFVVQDSEYLDHPSSSARLVLPPEITNLHQTRQYLLDYHHVSLVVEMDDDIVFSRRREDDPTKFRPMEDSDFDDMFHELEGVLEEYPMAGVVAREGANRITDQFLFTTRQMRLHAFNPHALRRLGARWDILRSPGPEDFAMLLQLFTQGETNIVLNNFCQNQGGSNTAGGCSTYRTLEVHADAVEHLAELYPDFVKVVEKTTKTAWEGRTRKDVIIQWKKAYKYGRSQQA